MNTCVEFSSSYFRPILSDDSQVNPGCYGAELAWWLCQELAKRGVETSYPNFEDWGWFVEYIVDDKEYWLCCGNVQGETDRWRIFLNAKAKGLFGRNRAAVEAAGELLSGVSKLLESADFISGIKWNAEYA